MSPLFRFVFRYSGVPVFPQYPPHKSIVKKKVLSSGFWSIKISY
jgi:hypothetical protein